MRLCDEVYAFIIKVYIFIINLKFAANPFARIDLIVTRA